MDAAAAAMLAVGQIAAGSATFTAGALYRVSDLAAAPLIVQVAANLLEAYRRGDPPPGRPPWRELLVGEDHAAARGPLAGVVAAVEAAADAVYAELARLWRARAAVLDAWAARLYAPPVLTPPPALAVAAAGLAGRPLPVPTVPTYDVPVVMMAELAAAGEAARVCTGVAAAFETACSAAVAAVGVVAERADVAPVGAVADVRAAAAAALAELDGSG